MIGLMLSVFLAALDQVTSVISTTGTELMVRCNRRSLLQLPQLSSHNLEEGKTTVGSEGNQALARFFFFAETGVIFP